MTDLLVRGAAQVMTGLPGAAMRTSGGNDIRIRNGVIHALGQLTPEPGERLIDAAGCVIYPGWVNTHHHLFQSLLKGIPAGINLPLVPWLAAVPVHYRRFFDGEKMLRLAARIGIIELMLSGCTTIADHQYHYYPGMPFDASAAIFEEAEKLGVRMVLCRGGQTQARAFDNAAPPQAAPETLEGFMTAVEADERCIDATGCVIYPGWVNTHHHLFQSLLKGIPAGINLALVPWLAAVPVPYRRFFDHEHALRLAARVGLVELMLSGCTTVADHQYHYYPGMPFDASAAVFDEAAKLGLRLVLCRGGQTQARAFDNAAPPQAAPETLEGFMAAVEADVARFHDPSPFSMRRVVSAITTPTWSVICRACVAPPRHNTRRRPSLSASSKTAAEASKGMPG